MAPKYPAEASLQIMLAPDAAGDNNKPLYADRCVLSALSACARGLPDDADVWNISKLQIEGQPVQQQTVIEWLNASYMLLHNEYYEELVQEAGTSVCSMSGLMLLLAFADAVGSSRGLLTAMDRKATAAATAGELTAAVQVAVPGAPMQQRQLRMNTAHYFSKTNPLLLRSLNPGMGAKAAASVVAAATAEARDGLRQQVAEQIEGLLHMAYRLQLPGLISAVQKFIRINSSAPYNPLLDAARLESVASPRVMAAHAHSNAGKLAFLNSITAEPCALAAGPGLAQLLKPVGASAMVTEEPVKFTAEVVREFCGFSQGERVSVELDLFGKSRLLVGKEGGASMAAHSVQLLLGLHSTA